MGKQPAIIELNGQKYDALTGRRIAPAPSATPQRVVSDIAPPSRHASHSNTPSTTVHKRQDHSHTLMRHVVKKPVTQAVTSAHNPPAETIPTKEPAAPVQLSHSQHPVHHQAHHVTKSPHISRFGDISPAPQAAHHVPVHHAAPKKLDVAPAPAHPPAAHAVASHTSSAEQLIQRGLQSIKDTPDKIHHHKRSKLRHRAAKRLGVSHRVINLAAGSAAFLLLGGFFAYQNIPNMAVRYAGMKAGINASLPGYHPPAFSVNSDVQYSPGQVAVKYRSNTDDRNYTVTQKKTDWDTADLEAFMTAQGGKTPQSYAAEDGTIYIQSSGDKVTAATVKDGVLKNLAGDSSLNTDQIIKIVSSM